MRGSGLQVEPEVLHRADEAPARAVADLEFQAVGREVEAGLVGLGDEAAVEEEAERARRALGDQVVPAGRNLVVVGDEASGTTPDLSETYAMRAFGAQFAEVAVHADTGEVEVRRLLGVFAAGRIVNPRTARSQFLGGMTMGLSMALHEQSVLDHRYGHVVNHDLAEYHIATCADVRELEAHWLDETDDHVNPLGTKGIGEIGIVGTAAAVANAAWHATGVRVRDLPITPDRFL